MTNTPTLIKELLTQRCVVVWTPGAELPPTRISLRNYHHCSTDTNGNDRYYCCHAILDQKLARFQRRFLCTKESNGSNVWELHERDPLAKIPYADTASGCSSKSFSKHISVRALNPLHLMDGKLIVIKGAFRPFFVSICDPDPVRLASLRPTAVPPMSLRVFADPSYCRGPKKEYVLLASPSHTDHVSNHDPPPKTNAI